MHFFARGGFHSGHGLRYSDFVTHDAAGHVHYHLLPILTTFGSFLIIARVLLFRAFWPDQGNDFGSQPLSGRFYVGAMLVLVLIALVCLILTCFPQFVWF